MGRMPCRRTDVGKKRFHLRFVREQLVVEVPRVPVDKYAAQIEDHRSNRRSIGVLG